MVYASVLGVHLIGFCERKLNFYQAALNIPQPPSNFNIIQANILTAKEIVVRQSMNNAKLHLEGMFGFNPNSKCVHGHTTELSKCVLVIPVEALVDIASLRQYL